MNYASEDVDDAHSPIKSIRSGRKSFEAGRDNMRSERYHSKYAFEYDDDDDKAPPKSIRFGRQSFEGGRDHTKSVRSGRDASEYDDDYDEGSSHYNSDGSSYSVESVTHRKTTGLGGSPVPEIDPFGLDDDDYTSPQKTLPALEPSQNSETGRSSILKNNGSRTKNDSESTTPPPNAPAPSILGSLVKKARSSFGYGENASEVETEDKSNEDDLEEESEEESEEGSGRAASKEGRRNERRKSVNTHGDSGDSVRSRKKEITPEKKTKEVPDKNPKGRNKRDQPSGPPRRNQPRTKDARGRHYWLSDMQAIEALYLAQIMKSAQEDDVDSNEFEHVDGQFVEMWMNYYVLLSKPNYLHELLRCRSKIYL